MAAISVDVLTRPRPSAARSSWAPCTCLR